MPSSSRTEKGGESRKKDIDKLLTKREKEVIEKRYGLNGNKAYTQKELAKQLRISRSYVSRIEARALDIIKGSLDIEFEKFD